MNSKLYNGVRMRDCIWSFSEVLIGLEQRHVEATIQYCRACTGFGIAAVKNHQNILVDAVSWTNAWSELHLNTQRVIIQSWAKARWLLSASFELWKGLFRNI